MSNSITMEDHNQPVPVQFVRGPLKQFKNPPQPHMCIQDTIKNTTDKLFVNVLAWQKIANPKQYTDPIPLYGGMQVPQGCGPNSNRPPLLIYAVMVNPDILKANGKYARNASDQKALVRLLCDFVEAMNPGLIMSRKPFIMKDRDLTGELKDVWLAIQNKREKEKCGSQEVMYKVYDIDGIGNDDEDEKETNSPRNKQNDPTSPNKIRDKSNQENHQNTTHCSTVDNDNIDNTFAMEESGIPSTSFRKDVSNGKGKSAGGWDEFSKRDLSSLKNGSGEKHKHRVERRKGNPTLNNGKAIYNFFPIFDNKTVGDISNGAQDLIDGDDNTKKKNDDKSNSKVILEPMRKLALHATDNKICDNNSSSALSSVSS